MTFAEPGSLSFENPTGVIPTIIAVAPLNRGALQNYIANLRQAVFHGAQVPFRVIHIDPVNDTQQEEHIPGCATCSL